MERNQYLQHTKQHEALTNTGNLWGWGRDTKIPTRCKNLSKSDDAVEEAKYRREIGRYEEEEEPGARQRGGGGGNRLKEGRKGGRREGMKAVGGSED